MASSPTRYPAPMRAIHWLSALLVLAAYLTSDGVEHGGDGRWHVLSGLLLLLLFVPRALGHAWRRRPAGTPPATRMEAVAAASMHAALLLFVVVQPLLGMAAIWSEARSVPIPFTGLAIPPPFAMSAWGEATEDAHGIIGTVFYAVIGLHVVAAFWHRVVRRDEVMQRML